MSYKRNIHIMYAMALLQGMVFYGPIATLYRQVAGVTVFQITVIESISLALCIFLEMPWGVIADRIGYKKTMVVCSAIYFVSKIIFWKAEGFGGFLLERILLSVVMAGLSGVEESILYLSVQKELHGELQGQRVFGFYYNLSTAGLLAASAIYTLAIGENYRLAGFLTAIIYGIAAVLSLGLIEVRELQKPTLQKTANINIFRQAVRSTLSDRRFLLFLLSAALFRESHQTITVFLNQLQYVRCGISDSLIGVIYIAALAAGLFGGFSTRFTHQLGERSSALLFFAAAGISCLVLAWTGNGMISVLSILGLRVSHSLFMPLFASLQNRAVQSENRATVLSVHGVLMDSVGIAANLLFGKLADCSLPAAMGMGGFFCLSGAVMYLLSERKH